MLMVFGERIPRSGKEMECDEVDDEQVLMLSGL
jgi:hypothetical protein